MLSKEELKEKMDTESMQMLVLFQILIEKIEFLEQQKFIFGSIKQFLKNGKTKFEDFIDKVFKTDPKDNPQDALHATSRLLILKERVEKSLANEYLIPVDEGRDRARKILSAYMVKPMVDKALQEMEDKNLFNF